MAIKISGTTVIDDSRNLTNVGGFKTVNGQSLFGSGNIAATGQIVSATPQFTGYTGYYAITTSVLSGARSTGYGTVNYQTYVLPGIMSATVAIPIPPNDALMKDIDFTLVASPFFVPYPDSPDQGGPYSLPGVNYSVRSRTEYRAVT